MAGVRPTEHSYAFVVPRCGEGIAGGAETLVRQLAEKLAERGNKIDILTTCAKDNRTWENHFPAGNTVENKVNVKRFPVSERNLDAWVPLQIRLSEGLRLSTEEELTWMENSVNSFDLYHYIDTQGKDYRAIFFAPYLFGTTFWGSLIHKERSILIPCLHDESYAYTNVIASMFRQVRGCLFNALPEKWLAESLYGTIQGDEVGMGFLQHEFIPMAKTSQISTDYLLYVGRKETGKNLHLLVDYFIEAKHEGSIPDEISLVIVGGGEFSDINRPKALNRKDIVDISHVDEEAKKSLIQHAVCLVQPSTNESFSIVLMEAWMQQVPVLVHARCAVTKYHVEQSNAGLYFGSSKEFSAVAKKLINDRQLARQMGALGSAYVSKQYNWQAVLERFDSVVDEIMSSR